MFLNFDNDAIESTCFQSCFFLKRELMFSLLCIHAVVMDLTAHLPARVSSVISLLKVLAGHEEFYDFLEVPARGVLVGPGVWFPSVPRV